MTELRKAAERLLEALEDGWVQRDDWVAFELRQAIEQAEQWDTSDMAHRSNGLAIDDDDIQEYKRPWVGMSDVEIAIYSSGFSGTRLAKEIEAQLKERNT